ncbi:membrane protein of ER body-like protein [Neltuma alba]|uniref:membrane protein of ER body-like protein n=1 Tax=Neltuma alba TaxID=207710 RepID=UPI0010A4C3EB|nr:membrane protein of ER body-like protein [Prosopis alba]
MYRFHWPRGSSLEVGVVSIPVLSTSVTESIDFCAYMMYPPLSPTKPQSMEQKHANERLQWAIIEQEEEQVQEEVALEGRQARKQLQDNVVSTVTLSSSSSHTPNGGTRHADNVSSVDLEPEELLIQKDEQVAEMGEIRDDNNHCHEEKADNAAVGLGLVAEFSGASSNGESIITNNAAASEYENSVYFDKQDGKWKCHHCTWTKQFDSPWTMPIWDLKQNSDLLMNFKTMIQHGPCFVCETKGSEANNASHEVQNGDGARSALPTYNGVGEFHTELANPSIQSSACNGVNNRDMKTTEDKGPFNSKSSPLHDSSEIKTTDAKGDDGETSTKADPELIEEIDQQLKELDVEAVLAKQETHDLFCPNCNSCITKRIILRKRKRSIRNLDDKSKRDKLDTLVSSERVDSSADETNQGDRANSTSDAGHLEQQPHLDNDPVQEQEVFRCLECFSIFIPRGNCFNLFSNSIGAREHETSQITSTIPASDVKGSSNITISQVQNSSSVADSSRNWFFSLFTSNKGKTSNDQGEVSSKNSKAGPAEQKHSSSIASRAINSPENGHLDSAVTGTSSIYNGRRAVPDVKPGHGRLNGNLVTNMGEEKNGSADIKKTDHSEANIVPNLPSENFSGDIKPNQERGLSAIATTSEALANSGEPAEDATLKPGEEAPDFLVQSNVGSRVPEKLLKDINKTPENFQNGYSSLIMQAQVADDAATGMLSSGVNAKISSGEDFILKKEVAKNTEGETKAAVSGDNTGGDVIVDVEEDKIESSASQIGDTDPINGVILRDTPTQAYVDKQSRAEIGETRGWEILKSIVYGGLIESITSLGILSSAVGSGAAPLNIIALGLANLIGGLFVIGHNLLELKNDKSGEDLQQTNTQEDRYQELLGRRDNFILHAVFAILSFLIFGSIPIFIYGILIRKNYQTEFKLAAVASTSLLCIILLAIGKVYTRRPPKSYSKTLFYYVTMSLAASGLSFIVGGLIRDLLEKLSNSESGFVITMPLLGQGTMDAAWRSY